MSKQLLYEEDARKKILGGVQTLASAVRVTLGHSGKHVILEKSWGSPVITKDGVTVSKEIELPDPFENMGAKLVNEAAQKTADEVGDGTTTATVLAEAMLKVGVKALGHGANPMALKRGIDAAVEAISASLKEQSSPVKKNEALAAIARVSANDDAEIGTMIADAMAKVGPKGVITIEEGKSSETVVDIVEGMQFDKGYISPYFVTKPQQMIAEFENARILFSEKKLSSARDLIYLLERCYQRQEPLILIAEDVDAEPLTLLVVNRLQGVVKVAAVKAPGFGDRRKAMLEDMAILTGGRVLTEDLGVTLDQIDDSFLGRAERVTIGKDRTTLVGGAGKKGDIKARIAQIEAQIEKTTSNYDREKFEERLAKLTGGVAVIKVGAATEVEMKEKKGRVEDALAATRAAYEEGIVTGGGVALLRAQSVLDDVKKRVKGDEKTGVDIVFQGIEAPIRQIAENAGADGSVIAEEVREKGKNFGFNASTGQIEDLVKAGIVDPTKVVRIALQNAASIAALILTTELLVTEVKDKKAVTGAIS